VITAATHKDIHAALEIRNFASAMAIAEAALAVGEVDETILRLASLRRQENGDLRGATELLLRAVDLSPNDSNILTAAADSLRHIGRLDEAVTLFAAAIAGDPTNVAAWYGQALAQDASGDPEAAQWSYRRVTELAPTTAPGFAGLSTTHAQLGSAEDARCYAEQACALAPLDPTALIARARCYMADDDAAAAVALLTQMPVDQIDSLTLLGDAYDRLGRYDDAFGAYVAANARFAQMYDRIVARSATESADAMARAVAAINPQYWPRTPNGGSSEATHHVFLLGYPRSGTTLVEQALASLPDVVTLEEGATLVDAECLLDGAGIARLATLPDDEIARLRASYWQQVRNSGIDPAGKIFIDMDPSKSAGLPVIARLFPEAKILIMQRDPRDTVWSCFRRAFVYNSLTIEFTSVERTARHYDATMRLIRTCVDTLPIRSHTVIYEDLVRDFDGTTRAMCDFIGVSWSPAMRDFDATARAGRVRTASAAQVRQALFDGSGQWRNYADKLALVWHLLTPWTDPRFLKESG
jgi:tetratricopeptide (TPR) repeat protein